MFGQKSISTTGAGSGIGREAAKLFASKGWFAGLADINEAGAKATAAERSAQGVTLAADVRTIRGAKATLGHTGGKLEVLFTCAGVLFMGPHEEIAQSKQEMMIDVNSRAS